MRQHTTSFEPVREWSTYPPVEETIRSESSLGWLRRIGPIVMTHRWRIIWSVIAAIIAMLAQILVPRVVGLAVDRALIERTSALSFFVIILLILGVARASATFGYRYALYAMAFKVQYQIRTHLYQILQSVLY